MNILVTGGAGYIGSHTIIELINAGHSVTVVDNLCNSSSESITRVENITGVQIPFHKVDIHDCAGLEDICSTTAFDACIHFAGLKAVGESVAFPWEYYENNINGTLVLVDVLRKPAARISSSVLPQPSMASHNKCQSRRQRRKESALIPTAGQSG